MSVTKNLQKLAKNTIERLRLDGEPVPIDNNVIAVGNYLIAETIDGITVCKLNSKPLYTLSSKELAVAIARLLRRNGRGDIELIQKINDIDVSLASKRFSRSVVAALLKKTPSNILENKIEYIDAEIDNTILTAKELIETI